MARPCNGRCACRYARLRQEFGATAPQAATVAETVVVLDSVAAGSGGEAPAGASDAAELSHADSGMTMAAMMAVMQRQQEQTRRQHEEQMEQMRRQNSRLQARERFLQRVMVRCSRAAPCPPAPPLPCRLLATPIAYTTTSAYTTIALADSSDWLPLLCTSTSAQAISSSCACLNALTDD